MNLFIVALLLFVVALAEVILEPLASSLISDFYGGFQPWHEAIIWVVSILIPALACSYTLSGMLSAKLAKMTRVSRALAHGNLNARFPVTGNDKDDFDALAQSFNDMAEAIEKQLNNERRLLADISHELRSPLARITMVSELLPRREGSEERKNLMLRLDREIERMNELVSLLLTQARDTFLSRDACELIRVDTLLLELAGDFAFQGEVDDKQVEVNIQGKLLAVGNPLLLRRMFGNLLSNALFYTLDKGKIEIAGGLANGKIIISIRDYGPGVPEEQLEDIFRAFYRVDNSRARTSGGVGLGLALVREAAIAHNGSVEAENASPGLLVTVILPLADVADKPHAPLHPCKSQRAKCVG